MAGGLLALLAVVVTASILRRPPATREAAASNSPTSPRPVGAPRATRETVKLEELKASRPEPVEAGRNPFRFKPRAAPARPAPVGPSDPNATSGGPATPPLPQGPPPIALKFIGLVDAPAQGGKLAVLSDGRSVFHGHEGEIIEGRYKIVRIGVESIEMMYTDGRGRQTIRLSGQ